MKTALDEPFLRRFISADGGVPALLLCVIGSCRRCCIMTRVYWLLGIYTRGDDVSLLLQRFMLVDYGCKCFVNWVWLLGLRVLCSFCLSLGLFVISALVIKFQLKKKKIVQISVK
ncbi:hypothetical protein N665_0060s0023 [Sinapis alba]|nr:hypothetical protein N665_0060s0023 [Sinapis alba]